MKDERYESVRCDATGDGNELRSALILLTKIVEEKDEQIQQLMERITRLENNGMIMRVG